MAFSAWSFQPPSPRFYEYFHSRNAYDDKGNLKQQTNNVFSYANKEMDRLTESYRSARTWDEKRELGMEIQTIIDDEAVFIPGWSRGFERVACWRWMRWPDSVETRFCPRATSYPYESYVYWIDEDMKRETLEAMRKGRTFPEVEKRTTILTSGRPHCAKPMRKSGSIRPMSRSSASSTTCRR